MGILSVALIIFVWVCVFAFALYIKAEQRKYELAKKRKQQQKRAKKIQKKQEQVTLLVDLETGEIIEQGKKVANVSFS